MATGNSTTPPSSPPPPPRRSEENSWAEGNRVLPDGNLHGRQVYLSDLPGECRIIAGNVGDHALIVPLLEQVLQSPMIEDFQSRTDEPTYAASDRLLIKRRQQIVGHLQVSRHIGWFQGHRIPLVKLQNLAILPEYDSFQIDRPAKPTGAHPKDSVYSKRLLNVAETMALREGAILGLVHTDIPGWFERQGWSRYRGQGHTQADTRAILSHLDAQQSVKQRLADNRGNRIEVRTWRHFELDCLRRIYGQVAACMWGPLHRSDESWQWLIGRKAHDQILLAIDPSRTDDDQGMTMARANQRGNINPRKILNDRFGDDQFREDQLGDNLLGDNQLGDDQLGDDQFEEDSLDENETLWTDEMTAEEMAESGRGRKEIDGSAEDEEITNHFQSTLCDPQNAIGYAVIRDSSIIEMFTLPGYDSARVMMIAMACREAIDRDHHFVSLHTPAVDPMHELLITAGGRWHDNRATMGGAWMFKILSPEKWIERIYPVLHERAREAGISRPFEIGLKTDCSDYRLTVTRRSSRLLQGEKSARHLACDWQTLQDLFVSNLTLAESTTERKMEIAGIDPSDEETLTALAALFPPKLFWQSPFELLRL